MYRFFAMTPAVSLTATILLLITAAVAIAAAVIISRDSNRR